MNTATKKGQFAALRNALDRLHFHHTITENEHAKDFIIDKLLTLSQDLTAIDNMEDAKAQTTALANAFSKLEKLP